MAIKLVACCDLSLAIGNKNKLIYKLPNDLKRFKQLTSGHFVVMGRKTFESILDYNGKPLPNRENIVLTRQKEYKTPLGVHVFHDIDTIIKHYTSTGRQDRDLWVLGGGKVYEYFLPFADEIHLTKVNAIATNADTYFPIINLSDWEITERIENKADENHEYDYTFITYKRKQSEWNGLENRRGNN